MSARASTKKKARQRTHRYTSNVFSMFDQGQIQEFKEAFNMIDQNRDGFVDREDLIEMLTSLGKTATDEHVEEMIREAPGPLNFTMFLTLFGEKLNGTDPEDVILNAFGCFDEKHTGAIHEDTLREVMTSMGDRWTDAMVDELFNTAPISNGIFDYCQFIKNLKHGHKDKDEAQAGETPAQVTPATEPQKPASPAAPKPALKQPGAGAKPFVPVKQPMGVLKKPPGVLKK